MQSFQEALNRRNVNTGDQYAVNKTLAHALNWRGKDETIRKNTVRVLKPVRNSLQRIPGITGDARGGRLHASLETIITRIFPLLVTSHPKLRYWIEMWNRDHPENEARHEDRSDSVDTIQPPQNSEIGDVTCFLHLLNKMR